jgi:hypothetical protein
VAKGVPKEDECEGFWNGKTLKQLEREGRSKKKTVK